MNNNIIIFVIFVIILVSSLLIYKKNNSSQKIKEKYAQAILPTDDILRIAINNANKNNCKAYMVTGSSDSLIPVNSVIILKKQYPKNYNNNTRVNMLSLHDPYMDLIVLPNSNNQFFYTDLIYDSNVSTLTIKSNLTINSLSNSNITSVYNKGVIPVNKIILSVKTLN